MAFLYYFLLNENNISVQQWTKGGIIQCQTYKDSGKITSEKYTERGQLYIKF